MVWTAVGSWLGGSGNTITTANQAIGDLVIVEVIYFAYNNVWPVTLTGGGCWWTCVAVHPGVSPCSAAVFFGLVTDISGTAPAATVGWSGTPPAGNNVGWAGQEFNSSLGYWTLTAVASLDPKTVTGAWPALTGTNPIQDLYFGYAFNGIGDAQAGTSTGYVYNANVDGLGDGAAYKLQCPAGPSHPVWADTYQAFGLMVRVTDPGPPQGGVAVAQPGGATWRRRYRRVQQAPPVAVAAFQQTVTVAFPATVGAVYADPGAAVTPGPGVTAAAVTVPRASVSPCPATAVATTAVPVPAIGPQVAKVTSSAAFPTAWISPGPAALHATTVLPIPGAAGSDVAAASTTAATATVPAPLVTDMTVYTMSFY